MSDPGAGAGRQIAIIGSGFSGLCLGIQLKKAGIESFTIFEGADRLGGTWRENTYPGAACDVPSMSYCFSFEQKTDWSRKWSPQQEILGYMEHCARKYEITPYIRFDTAIASARFDPDTARWHLRSSSGEAFEADVLVSGVGQLSRPFTPDIPGLDRYRGKCFHSARWDHDYDLEGKSVAVVGNAASAIQFVPRIAKQVKRLTIFQRSANWMLPRRDRAYSDREKQRFTRHPLLARLYRWKIWLQYELQFPVFRGNRFLARIYAKMATAYMRAQVSDPELRKALVPDYPIGGKRILISDDYYQCLERENVHVVSSGIDHVSEDSVVTRAGDETRVDALILATGFESTNFLDPMEIQGVEGRSLRADWKDGAEAYLGIAVPGFPNFLMMYGPNTNLGHNSIIFMIECQARYIVDYIRRLFQENLAYLDLRQEAMDAYNRRLQAELGHTVWTSTGKSWYKTDAGRITNNWSGTTAKYWWKTRKLDPGAYRSVGS